MNRYTLEGTLDGQHFIHHFNADNALGLYMRPSIAQVGGLHPLSPGRPPVYARSLQTEGSNSLHPAKKFLAARSTWLLTAEERGR